MNELEEIRNRIHELRGEKVMLDKDLALLYGVEVKVLNQAVKRNIKRFPEDFMFQLNKDEHDFLRSQIVTIKNGRGEHSKYLPYAFTEQGVAMLSSVLKSDTAIEVNIRIMRAFVAVRRYLAPDNSIRQLQGEVKELRAYIEEIMADQNDINEDTGRRMDELNHAVAMLQAAVLSEVEEPKEKRIFNLEVKGFKKE